MRTDNPNKLKDHLVENKVYQRMITEETGLCIGVVNRIINTHIGSKSNIKLFEYWFAERFQISREIVRKDYLNLV